ncbi:MAG: hypothetical protein ACRDTD_09145 [Pseudonocardiaceae bacterium]
MPRFSARWLEIAIEQYDARVEQLLAWPEGPREAYDARRDRWTTTYGDGAGLFCTPWSASISGCSSCGWCRRSQLGGPGQRNSSLPGHPRRLFLSRTSVLRPVADCARWPTLRR